MSFRSRLTLFFVFIVIVPMFSVAVVVFRLISDNETGKADARVAAGQVLLGQTYRDLRGDDAGLAQLVGADEELVEAVRTRNAAAARVRASALLGRQGLERIRVVTDGKTLIDVGDPNAIVVDLRNLKSTGSAPFAQLAVSSTTAQEFATRIKQFSALDVVVRIGGRVVGSTLPGIGERSLPAIGTVQIGGRKFRVRTPPPSKIPGLPGPVQFSILADTAATSTAVDESRLLAGAILTGFLILAFTFAVLVSRSLQLQIDRFLLAAQRLGGGDFSTPVPVEGRDEFALLGEEFNKMSRMLASRLDELQQERQRLQESLRRIGDTFASNLDREALLEIITRTALDAVQADYARASSVAEGDGLRPKVTVGEEGNHALAETAEHRALDEGAVAVADRDGRHALSAPLLGGDDGTRVIGVLTAVRDARAFSDAEKDLLQYLAGQAAVSMENVDLHHLVQRQAVTDELTGLFNHRRFQEVLAAEVGRARRFDQPLGFVMLDVDNFKAINDAYGHQQGDAVLREVARVLRECSREVDEPARYGGEEMAVVLPGTDLLGAYHLAERIREAVADLQVERIDDGEPLRVTVSVGVSALPDCADDKESLVRAADEALYEAKRSGKNRSVRAAPLTA